MNRLHLIEFGDQEWVPDEARNGGLEILAKAAEQSGVLDELTDQLIELARQTNEHHIVDLCSGAGGPLPVILKRAAQRDVDLTGTLTDLYPDPENLNQAARRSGGRITVTTDPVDATRVPESLQGIRTMFNSLHHFPPETAREILSDAARRQQPFFAVEFAGRSPSNILSILSLVPASLAMRPFLRPVHWKRWFYTYLVPLIPAGTFFDGLVSCLRVYNPDELEDLTRDITGMEWTAGRTRTDGIFPGYLTYLVGRPTTKI